MKTNTVKDLGIITQIILQKCFKKSFRTSKVILPLRHDSNEPIEKCSQNEKFQSIIGRWWLYQSEYNS